jgi:broad specificity phosphatase PhoE
METGPGGKLQDGMIETELTIRGIEQTTILASKLKELGVDLLDVSSGGNDLRAKIKVGPSYRES